MTNVFWWFLPHFTLHFRYSSDPTLVSLRNFRYSRWPKVAVFKLAYTLNWRRNPIGSSAFTCYWRNPKWLRSSPRVPEGWTCNAPQPRHMECHSVKHVYIVDIREVWPSSWMTHGAQYEAVSCDYIGSELAYMQLSVGWSACDERQAKQQDNHNSQWSGPQIGLQATHQIVWRLKKLLKITWIQRLS